jgi:hypothetical protein
VLAGHALGLENGLDFSAGISHEKFVEHALFGKVKTKKQKAQYSCGFAAKWLSAKPSLKPEKPG